MEILALHKESRNRRVAEIINNLATRKKKEEMPASHKSRGVPAIVGLILREEDLKRYSGLYVAIRFGEPCKVISSGENPESAGKKANDKGFKNLPILFVQPGVFRKAETN